MSAVADKIVQYYSQPENLADLTASKTMFIDGLRQFGTVLDAAAHAGISRQLAYLWRANDDDFRQAWNSAKEDTNDRVRGSLIRQATSDKNVVATIFYLKNNCPEYRDKLPIDLTSAQYELETGLRKVLARTPTSHSTKDLILDAIGIPRKSDDK